MIIKKFEDNVCYIDTDEIYCKEDKKFKIEDIYPILDMSEIPYEKKIYIKSKNINFNKRHNMILEKIINYNRNLRCC